MSRDRAIAPPDDPLPAGNQTRAARVFGAPRLHIDGDVAALAFSPDGALWSVEEPGTLRRWDPAGGQAVLTTPLSDLEMLWRFGPGARVVVSASDEVSLWDVKTGAMVTALAQPSWVDAVDLWGDPALLITGHDDGKLRLWDAASRSLVREMDGHHGGPVTAVAFSPDGRLLASAGEDRAVRVFEVASGHVVGTLGRHTDHVESLAWSPDGRRVYSAAWDRTCRVWDADSLKPVILLNTHADQVTALAVSPDGSLLACADSANTIHLWDTAAGTELRVLGEHDDEIRSLAFSPDGRTLASAGAGRVIHLWDPRAGRLLSAEGEVVGNRSGLALVDGGRRLVSVGAGAGLAAWDTVTAEACTISGAAGATSVAGSPDGRWLAAGTGDGRVRLWNAADLGRPPRLFEGQSGPVGVLAFNRDSTRLASVSTSDGTVWIWDVAQAVPVLVVPLAAEGCTVEAVAWHPAGRTLAAGGIDWLETGGSDGAICLWDVAEPGPGPILGRGATALAFHPTGRHLAAATTGGEVCVWDVDGRTVARELVGHSDMATCVAYSPDGRWLLSGSEDRTLRVWAADSGTCAAVHELETSVQAVAFSADGRFVFTVNGNTTCSQFEARALTGATPAASA